MGLTWSQKCHILVILLGNSNLHHSRDVETNCKRNMRGRHFHLQLANGNNLCTCCFHPCSLALLFLLLAKTAWVGKRCSAFAFELFSPLPMRLQNKESNVGIWSPMTGLDVAQTSFRCRFGCRLDQVGFPRDKFTVKMQTFRGRRLNNFLFGNLVCLLLSQKDNVLAILWRPRSQPTPQG